MTNKTNLPKFNIVLLLITLIVFIIPLSLMSLLLTIFGGYKPFKLFMTLPFNYVIWRENTLDDFELIETDKIKEELW